MHARNRVKAWPFNIIPREPNRDDKTNGAVPAAAPKDEFAKENKNQQTETIKRE